MDDGWISGRVGEWMDGLVTDGQVDKLKGRYAGVRMSR